MPGELKLKAPGLSFAAATSAFAFAYPMPGETTSTKGDTPIGVTATTCRLVAQVLVHLRGNRNALGIQARVDATLRFSHRSFEANVFAAY